MNNTQKTLIVPIHHHILLCNQKDKKIENKYKNSTYLLINELFR